jgi:cytochrome oxidase Cu insertion factor (SCO1/SenC/PrrC family)
MHAMRLLLVLGLLASAHAATPAFTESDFRATLGVTERVRLSYRGVDCGVLTFDQFAQAMLAKGVRSDVERALDGSEITVTVRRSGAGVCVSPYPPIAEMPEFELRDLAGKLVSAASLRGKPTLVNFYFAECVPCILEVGPLNGFAADRPDMNFLAITFDEPEVARAFVSRYKFRWRIVPDARELIDRVRVKHYPTMALFDGNGRLLGMRRGGVRDELEAATVAPQLARWVDGLLRTHQAPPAR